MTAENVPTKKGEIIAVRRIHTWTGAFGAGNGAFGAGNGHMSGRAERWTLEEVAAATRDGLVRKTRRYPTSHVAYPFDGDVFVIRAEKQAVARKAFEKGRTFETSDALKDAIRECEEA